MAIVMLILFLENLSIIWKVQLNPAILKSQGKWKKVRNNRGSVKFVTMNHFLIKYSTV